MAEANIDPRDGPCRGRIQEHIYHDVERPFMCNTIGRRDFEKKCQVCVDRAREEREKQGEEEARRRRRREEEARRRRKDVEEWQEPLAQMRSWMLQKLEEACAMEMRPEPRSYAAKKLGRHSVTMAKWNRPTREFIRMEKRGGRFVVCGARVDLLRAGDSPLSTLVKMGMGEDGPGKERAVRGSARWAATWCYFEQGGEGKARPNLWEADCYPATAAADREWDKIFEALKRARKQ